MTNALLGRRVFVVLLCVLFAARLGAALDVDVLVPDKQVKGEDAYLCTTVELPDKPMKLVGVAPLAKKEVVHHILLFGCQKPFVMPTAGAQPVWECGRTCDGGEEHILYGWARDAPVLSLPQGVGFSIGPGSSIRYIVAQVHYLQERPAGDHSGVRLKLEERPVPYAAGMLSYASWFTIPPGKPHHLVQNNCCYRGWQPLTTFAVRVHTHGLGRVVMMTRPHRNGTGLERLAVGNPQAPQGFNPLPPAVLWPGDRLDVTCDFDSSQHKEEVHAGGGHTNEMCNLYLMVYGTLPHIEMCSDGSSLVGDDSPGNLPIGGALLPDPFPLWKPFQPQDLQRDGHGVFGGVTGVTMGPDGTVWVLTRGGRVWDETTFDPQNRMANTTLIPVPVVHQLHADTGKVLRSWGAGVFAMPHMISVDRDGAVWVADTGLHQVLKFNDAGRLLLAIGERFVPGSDKAHLCKPAQVTFMNNGHVLVADGYCNSRVVRFDAAGKWHCQYELPQDAGGLPAEQVGKAGGAGMAVAHSVAVQECDQAVFVADRELKRVHAFHIKTHALLATYDMSTLGKPWALLPGPYGRTLALVWEQGREAQLVDVTRQGAVAWALPGTEQAFPHDIALGPAPLLLTGAGDRLAALYVAPLCPQGCGPLQRYILFPSQFNQPRQQVLPAAPQKPVLSHLKPGLAADPHAGHGGHAAEPAAPGAAASAQQQEQQQEQQQAAVAEAQDLKGDEQADQAAQEAERQEEKEEERPEVAANLTSQLAKVQQVVAQPSAAAQANKFETIYSRAYVKQQHGIGTVVAVGAVCTLLGAFVGMFAYSMMQKFAFGDSKAPAAAAAAGVGAGVSYHRAAAAGGDRNGHHNSNDSGVQRELAETEELEHDMLLHNQRHERSMGV